MSSELIVGISVVAVGGYVALIYNTLVTHRNRFKNSFSQIDVQLQRRYELIPNLVEIAKGYLKHENETLTAVTNARNNAAEKCKAASGKPEDGSLVGALAGAEASLAGPWASSM